MITLESVIVTIAFYLLGLGLHGWLVEINRTTPDPDSYISTFIDEHHDAYVVLCRIFWMIDFGIMIFILLAILISTPFILLYKFIYGYFEWRKERVEKEKKRAAMKEDEMIEMLKRKTEEAEKLIEQNK